MTKGFVTIATGSENYYRIAANLLASYRYFTKDPYPFAIICDRENKYTDLFDDVVIMNDPAPTRSYMDKVYLPVYAPYDETIFIDSDVLVYRDINCIWDVFKGAPDFCVLGQAYPVDSEIGWFKKEDAGEFSDKKHYIPEFVGDVYYLRKTDKLKEFYNTALYIWEHYTDYKFRTFIYPADESVFALAVAVYDFRPADRSRFPVAFFPLSSYFKEDITTGVLEWTEKFWPQDVIQSNCYMAHWGSGITRTHYYKIPRRALYRMISGKNPKDPGADIYKAALSANLKAKVGAARVLKKLGVFDTVRNRIRKLRK